MIFGKGLYDMFYMAGGILNNDFCLHFFIAQLALKP